MSFSILHAQAEFVNLVQSQFFRGGIRAELWIAPGCMQTARMHSFVWLLFAFLTQTVLIPCVYAHSLTWISGRYCFLSHLVFYWSWRNLARVLLKSSTHCGSKKSRWAVTSTSRVTHYKPPYPLPTDGIHMTWGSLRFYQKPDRHLFKKGINEFLR